MSARIRWNRVPKRIEHIPQLDGIRALAACAVFVHHSMQAYAFQPRGSAGTTVLWFTGEGHLGVDVFFVLSGFLITSLLIGGRNDQHYFHNFYWKRFLRIQPVLWVHLGLTALFFHLGIIPWPSSGYIALSLLFLVNFGSTRFGLLADRFGGPAWSLAIEEQFYLLWPLVVRRLSPKSIYRLAISMTIICVLLRIIVLWFKSSLNIRYTFYRCDGLALGALLALQYMEAECGPFTARLIEILNAKWTVWIGILVSVVLFNPVTDARLHGQGDGFAIFATSFFTYRLIRHVILYPKSLAWLGNSVLVYIGTISYAVYMFHGFTFYLYDYLVPIKPMSNWIPLLLRFMVTSVATVAVCTLSLYAVERPIQSLRRYVLK